MDHKWTSETAPTWKVLTSYVEFDSRRVNANDLYMFEFVELALLQSLDWKFAVFSNWSIWLIFWVFDELIGRLLVI